MLIKNPKPASRKWLKRGALVIFGIEAVCFALCYGLWYKVNSDRDSRKYLKNNYPSLLEAYYQAGEFISSDSKIRDIDIAYWNSNEQQLDRVDKKTKEVISKNQQFMNVLQSASESSKPFYRISKEDIAKTVDK